MSQQKYAYRIDSLKLKQGTPVKTGKINVFVGANNCGKTQVLKDMLSYITGSANSHVVLEELAITFPETWKAMKESYCIPVYDTNSGQQLRHISPTLDAKRLEFTTTNLEDNLEKWLINNKLQFRKLTGASFVTFLNTDNRLKLAAAQPVQNLEKNGVKNVLEALYLAGAESTFKVRENAKAIFNTDVYLDTSNLGTIQYKVGKDFSGISENTQKSHSELSPYPLLDTQGDGLRSAVGIISALTAVKKPIILMDEPEAFLHPPQALLLGEMISNLIDDSQQIFIATHSADFVRGLLSTTRDAVIIHLDRISDTETIAHPLDSVTLNKIITNPLLSSSRVLEGMFYKGVVATEADADTVFYQRLFQRVNASDEIHFVNAHNKQTLKNIIEPYQKLGIRYALIADADIIRDKHDLTEILKLTADETTKATILSLRDEVYEFFQSKSKYETLCELKGKTLELASKDLPENYTDDEISKILFDFRSELKKLREESDDLAALKNSGKNCMPPEIQSKFIKLCEECSQIGLFIVPVGELESWLVDYGIKKSNQKTKWITSALDKLFELEYDANKEIWIFIDLLKRYLTLK